MTGTATIRHAELDAFYASLAIRDDPTPRGTPVAVGGAVILCASYEARARGVTSAMSTTEALRRSPALRIASTRFTDYIAVSRQVMTVFERFTPLVEPTSIDEAFLTSPAGQSVGFDGEPASPRSRCRRR